MIRRLLCRFFGHSWKFYWAAGDLSGKQCGRCGQCVEMPGPSFIVRKEPG